MVTYSFHSIIKSQLSEEKINERVASSKNCTQFQQFDITCPCPRDLTFPWQPYFDWHVFQNFKFSNFKIKQKLSGKVFRKTYGVFICFNCFWADFGRFFEVLDKSRSPRWRTKMAATLKWLCNCYVMWRLHLFMRTSKETFADSLSTLQVFLS